MGRRIVQKNWHLIMKKLLVTGGNGLVGSTIKADVKVSSNTDLRNSQVCNKVFELHQPTQVIHCAGKVGGLGGNMNYKGEFFYDNIMINTNVIECARKHNVKKLIAFLSTCIFPNKCEYPLKESKIHFGPPHSSNDAYAYAKRMTDIQIRAYREQYGLNYSSVIPTNIYGPKDNFSLTNGHVIPMLLHKIFLAERNNQDLVVWGSGKPLREFIYSKDVGKLSEWAVENYNEVEPIIFSTSEEISISELVDLLVKEFNFKGNVKFDSTKPDGQFRKPSDNSKLKSYLPNFEFTPIEVGIKETVKWFIENYENARK
jgi:GDP-L-fucose synthase